MIMATATTNHDKSKARTKGKKTNITVNIIEIQS
jgi:hypothetical protein